MTVFNFDTLILKLSLTLSSDLSGSYGLSLALTNVIWINISSS